MFNTVVVEKPNKIIVSAIEKKKPVKPVEKDKIIFH